MAPHTYLYEKCAKHIKSKDAHCKELSSDTLFTQSKKKDKSIKLFKLHFYE